MKWRVVSCCWILCSALTANAILVTGYSEDVHDRFHGDGSFVGDGLDFSGVGVAANGAWATMISRDHFLSASHFSPNSPITFFHPDGTTTSTRMVSGMSFGSVPNTAGIMSADLTIPPNTDLWIGKLTTSLDPAVAHYAIAPALSVGTSVLQVGNCPNTATAGTCDSNRLAGSYPGVADLPQFVVGTNTVQDFGSAVSVVSGVGVFNSFSVDYVQNGTTSNDTLFEGGDSGGPTFHVSGTTLSLVGIHSGVDTPTLTSVDVRLDAYRTDIATAVPEPSSWLFLGMAGLLIGCRRWIAKARTDSGHE